MQPMATKLLHKSSVLRPVHRDIQKHPYQYHGHTQPLPHAQAHRQQAQMSVWLSEKFGDKSQAAISDQEHG
jgi:hypothetical protein